MQQGYSVYRVCQEQSLELGVIISLKFSLARVLFIINKENMYSEYTYERVLRRNLSLGCGIIDSGLFPGCMNETKALCKVVEYGKISVKSH